MLTPESGWPGRGEEEGLRRQVDRQGRTRLRHRRPVWGGGEGHVLADCQGVGLAPPRGHAQVPHGGGPPGRPRGLRRPGGRHV